MHYRAQRVGAGQRGKQTKAHKTSAEFHHDTEERTELKATKKEESNKGGNKQKKKWASKKTQNEERALFN